MAHTARFEDYTHILPPLRITPVKGGSAGDFTVAGIATVDKILGISQIEFETTASANVEISTVADLTTEFTISGAATINNTSGTDTTGALLLVMWADYDR